MNEVYRKLWQFGSRILLYVFFPFSFLWIPRRRSAESLCCNVLLYCIRLQSLFVCKSYNKGERRRRRGRGRGRGKRLRNARIGCVSTITKNSLWQHTLTMFPTSIPLMAVIIIINDSSQIFLNVNRSSRERQRVNVTSKWSRKQRVFALEIVVTAFLRPLRKIFDSAVSLRFPYTSNNSLSIPDNRPSFPIIRRNGNADAASRLRLRSCVGPSPLHIHSQARITDCNDDATANSHNLHFPL